LNIISWNIFIEHFRGLHVAQSVIHDCKIIKTSHTIVIVLYWYQLLTRVCHKSVTNVARATWTRSSILQRKPSRRPAA